MKRSVLVLLLAAVVSVTPIVAQESGSELTIEEVYLQNAEIRIIREQAISQDRDMKLLALENIQQMIDDGKLSTGSPEAHAILDYLSGEGLTHQVRENRRLVNYYPEVRRRAVNLLGQLGGEQATNTLLSVLRDEIEPMVMAEAAYALGKIGTNKENQTSQTLAAVVLAQDAVAPDNNFAYAALLAFEKLAESNNGINDTVAVESVVRIAQGNYIRLVRQKALEVLDELRDYR